MHKVYTSWCSRSDETKDEPWAWEAREFLRKKLVGEMLLWIPSENKSAAAGNREYGTMYLGKGKYELKDYSNISYFIKI